MPSLGDFFRIALPRSFCEPWDHWVQQVLTSSRATLGVRWDECYMSAPIWRFSLAAGLAGPQAVHGVLMPSVDRVGRAFPLTLAQVGAGDAPDLAALEDIALAALEDDMTKTRLTAALADVPCVGTRAAPKGATWQTALNGDSISFQTADLPRDGDALQLFDVTTCKARA